jgi:hypothetical protein
VDGENGWPDLQDNDESVLALSNIGFTGRFFIFIDGRVCCCPTQVIEGL